MKLWAGQDWSEYREKRESRGRKGKGIEEKKKKHEKWNKEEEAMRHRHITGQGMKKNCGN